MGLRVVSAIGTGVLAVAGVALFRTLPRGTSVPFAESFGRIMAAVPLLLLAGALLFIVVSYEVDAGTLRVRRLLWSTSISLDRLEGAWCDPSAMSVSLRIFGNGGLYSITGFFRNPTLGNYRAFVTDPKKAVVLRIASKVVVVSPAEPRAFLEQLLALVPGVFEGQPTLG
jgi:hypothetical protein